MTEELSIPQCNTEYIIHLLFIPSQCYFWPYIFLFCPMVEYSDISIYLFSVLWIRSMSPARLFLLPLEVTELIFVEKKKKIIKVNNGCSKLLQTMQMEKNELSRKVLCICLNVHFDPLYQTTGEKHSKSVELGLISPRPEHLSSLLTFTNPKSGFLSSFVCVFCEYQRKKILCI